MNTLSILPTTAASEDIIFYFLVLARVTGLFLIAPFLSNHLFPARVRVFIIIFTTLILGTALWGEYRGPQAQYTLILLKEGETASIISIGIFFALELSIGFLIGFAFALLYEAILLAGQLIGVMAGLSITEILDPISQTPRGLIGQLLTMLTTLLILSMDLHHFFLRTAAASFHQLPLGGYALSYEFLGSIQQGTGRIFHHGFQVAAIPFAVLGLVTVALGFMARVMPEMNIFMVGFPLKILVGFYSLFFTLHYFPEILTQAFNEYHNLARMLVRYTTAAP